MKNKCLKTLLAASLAVAMVAPMVSTSALAATDTVKGDTSNETTTSSANVKYAVTEGYEWNIHADIDFGKDKGVSKTSEVNTQTVSVTKNVIPDGKKLHISVAGKTDENDNSGEFKIKNGSTELTYTITSGQESITTGGTVLDVAAGTNTDSKNLTFTLSTTTGAAEVAGNYSGTVTYTASIVDATQN